MKTFALVGAAGYVAKRHFEAIKNVGGKLIAAVDPHDSVGILDHYFPETEFFTDMYQFEKYLLGLRDKGTSVDYVSVCSPNELHSVGCVTGLTVGANVICEKPLVLDLAEITWVEALQRYYGGKVHPVLQLRYHPELIELKESLNCAHKKVEIYYVTPRGPWYHKSWKGSVKKSGGIITNIGIHLFDMVIWLFGSVKDYTVRIHDRTRAEGTVELERATVNWFLSIDRNDSQVAYRSITVDDKMIRFDKVFTELHTEVYQNIIDGKGFGIDDARPSLELVHQLRNDH